MKLAFIYFGISQLRFVLVIVHSVSDLGVDLSQVYMLTIKASVLDMYFVLVSDLLFFF